jgi:regulatory protein
MDLIPTALAYLARYSASTAHLRLVLQRKVLRRSMRDGSDVPSDAAAAAIEAAVARMTELGLLDDAEYASSLARQSRARGESINKIRLRLKAKGLDATAIAAALMPLDHDEHGAATRYAQRKRLGPYRRNPGKPDQPNRDIAALCRAGFSIAVSRKVVEG